ncbi:hypothetical protein OROMI_033668 [Orobanche minor]
MDKFNFVSDGEYKLPPGFRFQPTDEEIVFEYLASKTFSNPLPAQVIPELNIFSFDPWELPGNSDKDMYFFCNENSRRTERATSSGYWKATGTTKHIICPDRIMPIVGIKKTLVFYQGKKDTHRSRSGWIMHEYCIVVSEDSASNNNNIHQRNSSQGSLVRIGNWTLCHIFLKTTGSTGEDNGNGTPRNCDFMTDTYSSSASSSSPHYDPSVYNEVSSSFGNGEYTGRHV